MTQGTGLSPRPPTPFAVSLFIDCTTNSNALVSLPIDFSPLSPSLTPARYNMDNLLGLHLFIARY